MRKIDKLLKLYGESHQTSFNKKVHFVCVPAIFFSVLGLLYCVPVSGLFSSLVSDPWLKYCNLATLLVVGGIVYYATLSTKLMISMVIASIASLYLIMLIDQNPFVPLWIVMVAIFVIAWIGQFIGHKHEGKKPSFFEDIQYLMIGPAWTISHFFDRIGARF